MSVLDTLITDRTEADVERVTELRRKILNSGWSTLTDDERVEWLGGMRGAYNATDLNRVEEAVEFVADYLNSIQDKLDDYRNEYGVGADAFFDVTWSTVSPDIKTDWSIADVPTASQMDTYLKNVSDVTDALPIDKDIPSSMNGLNVDQANRIEQALLDEYSAATAFEEDKKELIRATAASFVYSDMVYSGQLWG